MHLIELPLVLTVGLLAFTCGLIVPLIIVFVIPRSERVRLWLAKIRGGEQLRCPACARVSSQPFIVGGWHRMPRWLGHTGKGIVCSVACARVVENQPLGTGRKILEIEDVVRWASGATPSDRGKWISADSADPS